MYEIGISSWYGLEEECNVLFEEEVQEGLDRFGRKGAGREGVL